MIPYYFLIVFPVIVQLVSRKYRITFGNRLVYKTRAGSIDVFMLMFLFLLVCRGVECGIDTQQYLNMFNDYSMQSISQLWRFNRNEFAYKLLNKLVATVGGNFQWILMITSLVSVCPLWYFYKRESENQLLTIALFLSVAPFVVYFSGIRQIVAVSLGIPAWYYVKKRKKIHFLVSVLVAMQFHTSAFILVVLYPLYHAKITARWLWFVVPSMILVYVYKTIIFNFLVQFLWKEYSDLEETGATTVLLLLILFGAYSYIIADESKMDSDTIAMRNILLLSITLQFFAMLHPLSMRFNYYFLVYVPLLIPRIANRSKHKYNQVAKLSVVIMTTYFFCYFINNIIHGSDSMNVFPYIPFWRSYYR